jgi:hypothetical protein
MSKIRIAGAAVLYVTVVAVFLAARPSFAFREDGAPRQFGAKPGMSVIGVGPFTAAASIASIAAFALREACTELATPA